MGLGRRIKDLRIARGLTQADLAEHCHVTREAVSQWESGDTKELKSENLLRVCEKLYVDPRYLVFGSKDIISN